jgi:hypothetical protein
MVPCYHLNGKGYEKIQGEYPQIMRDRLSVAIEQADYQRKQIAKKIGDAGDKIKTQGHSKMERYNRQFTRVG